MRSDVRFDIYSDSRGTLVKGTNVKTGETAWTEGRGPVEDLKEKVLSMLLERPEEVNGL